MRRRTAHVSLTGSGLGMLWILVSQIAPLTRYADVNRKVDGRDGEKWSSIFYFYFWLDEVQRGTSQRRRVRTITSAACLETDFITATGGRDGVCVCAHICS